jgi:hypothetical protein
MKEKFYIGGMFILAGVFFLLSNFQIISFEKLWPGFVLLPGVFFLFDFFRERKNIGLLIAAAVLISLGLIFFYCEVFGWESMEFLWTLFVLAPGLGFFFAFFKDRKSIGLLMPATILTSYGLLFLYCEIVGWEQMEYVWPVFILGPGLGFFLMYYLGTKEKKLLIPGSILVFIALINIGLADVGSFFWPVLLIGIGLFLLLLKK